MADTGSGAHRGGAALLGANDRGSAVSKASATTSTADPNATEPTPKKEKAEAEMRKGYFKSVVERQFQLGMRILAAAQAKYEAELGAEHDATLKAAAAVACLLRDGGRPKQRRLEEVMAKVPALREAPVLTLDEALPAPLARSVAAGGACEVGA